MFRHCGCCKARHPVCFERAGAVTFCDTCEVAYLEFKLRLLVAVYRETARKADEV